MGLNKEKKRKGGGDCFGRVSAASFLLREHTAVVEIIRPL
jgi:hypothetical protein